VREVSRIRKLEKKKLPGGGNPFGKKISKRPGRRKSPEGKKKKTSTPNKKIRKGTKWGGQGCRERGCQTIASRRLPLEETFRGVPRTVGSKENYREKLGRMPGNCKELHKEKPGGGSIQKKSRAPYTPSVAGRGAAGGPASTTPPRKG